MVSTTHTIRIDIRVAFKSPRPLLWYHLGVHYFKLLEKLMSCNGCGAPISETALICEFCGVAQKSITDPDDEIKAIQEIGQAWANMGRNLGSIFGDGHPMKRIPKVKAFWQSAYMPQSSQGLFAAAEQALLQHKKAALSDAETMAVNPILLGRASNCIDMLQIKAPGDPRIAGLQNLLEKKKSETSAIAKLSCFPTATRILTPTGHREIGDIEPGDTVLSTNASGQLVHATVTVKKSYGSSPITRIVLAGEPRDLRTTAHHSFKTDSSWKRASQLQAGDTLLRVDDSGESRLVRIEAITTEAPEPVLNLHTTGPHNFIAEGVLAHNFTELRWLRTWVHRLVVDPFHDAVVEGVKA
jgi:hypothetical protein